MVELKTLQDMEFWRAPNINRELSIEWYKLKEEAIKWIKYCGCIDNINSIDWQQCDGCKRFIKFFNITEEDLK